MPHFHAVVWLDHAQAHLISLNPKEADFERILSHPSHRQTHHKAGAIGSGKSGEDPDFFRKIADDLDTAQEILIMGPGQAKLAFMRFLRDHAPLIERRVVGIETVDHPTDHQIAAHARAYFRAADRLRPQ